MTLISVVIPAYNEAESIKEIIERLKAQGAIFEQETNPQELEIIVVNDGSSDNTGQLAASYPGIHVINHQTNLGYGAALKSGFKTAQGEYIAFLDADSTYPPESLSLLYQTLQKTGADMVVGSRFAGEASHMSWVRSLGNYCFTKLLCWIGNQKITDAASGMRIFRKEVLPRLYPLPDGLDFILAMSTRSILERLKIAEVPIPYPPRMGRSKLRIVQDGLRFLRTILFTALLYNPLRIFGMIGIILFVVGTLVGLQPVRYYVIHRLVLEHYIYRLFVVLILFVAGLNLISFGVLANFALSIWYKRDLHYSFWERLILKEYIYGQIGLVGAFLLLAGVVLNIPAMYQYFTTGLIYMHWSYFATGATLILCGIQLFTTSLLVMIFKELGLREQKVKQDLGQD